ncbi:queuosine salvage protein-like protein [Tanacetum coccineum]|uniref:Queuosine 5'-phosphate N-glycosylase/hydrolase n=1 Tax=Tanacetum coccineum TaxID=301880 RepID=A0ABQ5D0H5_9ASTR
MSEFCGTSDVVLFISTDPKLARITVREWAGHDRFIRVMPDTPSADLNYDDLDSGLKAALENDQSVFDADRLQKYTGFRDHTVYKGHQVFLYKRDQIFAADV